MINISDCPGKDNPPRPPVAIPRPRPPAASPVRDRADGRSAGTRFRDGLALLVGVTLDWLAYFMRRRGDQWFAMNDTEAYWWGWQITKTHGALGRRYRDTRFDTLAGGELAGAGVGHHGPFG